MVLRGARPRRGGLFLYWCRLVPADVFLEFLKVFSKSFFGPGESAMPEAIKILHTADVHLDWLFDKLPPEQRAQRRQEVAARLKQIVDLAVAQQVHVLLMAGDLFHEPQVALGTADYALGLLEGLAAHDIQVGLISGNHDPLVPDSVWEKRRFPPHVHVFRDPEWRHVEIVDGLHLYGLPFIPALADRPVLDELSCIDAAGYHVALLHGQFIDAPGAGPNVYYPFHSAAIAASGLDYLALGHVHRPQEIGPLGRTHCWYPGSPTRFTFRNIQERQVVLLELRDAAVTARSLYLPDRPYLRLSFVPATTPVEEIYRALGQLTDTRACVQVVLEGLAEPESELLADAISRDWAGRFFFLEVLDRRESFSLEEAAGNTVRAFFLQEIARRLASAEENERAALYYARQYGLAALRGEKLR